MMPSSSRNRGVAERIHVNLHSVDDPSCLATAHRLARQDTVCRYMITQCEDSDRRRKGQEGAHNDPKTSNAQERVHGSIGDYVRSA